MHQLSRIDYPEPEALQRIRASIPVKKWNWDFFPTPDKKTVRDTLLIMQNFRCAYCERMLHDKQDDQEDKWDGHIEHFRRKNSAFHPELTFIWDNLFYSCCTRLTCGRHKDAFISDKTQYVKLIDPCKENPEHFFVFDEEGKIQVRLGLTNREKSRAQFTIDAFNLNQPMLVRSRLNLMNSYRWLKEKTKAKQLKVLKEKRSKVSFITALYHYFGEKVVP